jgi:hypothetical protein
VAKKQWILLLLLTAISALAGCGGGSTVDVHNQPPPQVSQVSIAFNPAPAGSLQPGTPTDITAVVTNDSGSVGVDWTLICQNTTNCGSLSSLHTASGQPTTYTPPSTLSGNTETVNVVAFATADHTQNVDAPITITGFGSNFIGTYVLQAQGIDVVFGQPYQFAGVINLDGNGGIVPVAAGQPAGEQIVNVVDPNLGSLMSKAATITGGSYFLGSDGRGTITITTNDPTIGGSGTETFAFVFLSNSQALITQTDFTASARGTMDLQTSVAAPTGGYAFVVSGTDLATLSATAFGGVFNIDSPNTISGKGSISDQDRGGTLTSLQTLSGTVSNPDAFGAVTIDLNLGFASAPVQFIGYTIDATHMKLIESDNTSGTGFGSTGGVAIGQGPATGTFKTTAALSGTYVFGIPGVDLTQNLSGTIPSTYTSVGVFTADGSGNLNQGFTDTFLQQSCVQSSCTQNFVLGSKISAAFTGTYTVAASPSAIGTGRGRANITSLSPKPTPNFVPAFIFYLTGNGNPALVLDVGDTTINPQTGFANYPSVGAGILYPQAAGPLTFGGTYGFGLTQQVGSETDDTGQMTADTVTNTLSGFTDTSSGFSGDPLSGTFVAPSADGRFAVSLSGQAFDFLDPNTLSFATEFYAIDSGHGFFVETDLKDPNFPSGVVSFGYYAARTPVCPGCP